MPSKLAQDLVVAALNHDGERLDIIDAAFDAILAPVREALIKADHVLRVYGYNIERREILPALEDLEIK